LTEQPPLGKRNTWPQTQSVKVYISSAFTDEQENGVRDALSNWQAERTLNTSAVTFDIVVGAPPSNPTGTYCEIRAQAPPSGIPNATDRGATSSATGPTWLLNAIIYVNPSVTRRSPVTEVVAHELGHTFGLDDCRNCFLYDSVMAPAPFGVSPNRTGRTDNPSDCDNSAVARLYATPTPTPTPTPNPTPGGGGCGECFAPVSACLVEDNGYKETESANFEDPPAECCDNAWEQAACIAGGGQWINCSCLSPIVIDVVGNGFNLTNAQNGVLFDLTNSGTPLQLSWTSANSDDAWLVLDRNENGRIDHGREMFGDATRQPVPGPGEVKNGFRALAMFDRPATGGNNDGKINQQDAIFSDLRLWQDLNHNGFSEPNELFTLPALGLQIIDLDYSESRRRDEHDNWFRFRSKVRDAQGAQLGRWAWDVFLRTPQ